MKCKSCARECEEAKDGFCWFCRMDKGQPLVEEKPISVEGACETCGGPTKRLKNGKHTRFCSRKCTMRAAQRRKR